MPYITVKREVRPEGAAEAAERFRALARDLRLMAEQAQIDKSDLDQTWEGRARDHFFDEFGSVPDELERMAERLDQVASAVQNKTVTIEEQAWVPALVD